MTLFTPATFPTALAAATGGETFELTDGNYGVLKLTRMEFSSDVTIISADPESPAIFNELNIQDTNNLVLNGILFDYVAEAGDPSWVRPFKINNSTFITICNSIFNGDRVSDYGIGFGLDVFNSNTITIESNEFFDFYKAIAINESTDIVVIYNNIHTIRSDGLNLVSVDGAIVEGNWFHDFRRDFSSGDHADMIQLFTKVDKMTSRNIAIRGNFLDAGIGNLTQALFLGNSATKKLSFEEYAYRNILIEDNVIYNDHVHGISLGAADGLTIRNNTVLFDPHVIAPRGWVPVISVSDVSINVTIENNITGDVWNWDKTANHPGWVVNGNLLVNHLPDRPNFYDDLFVNALTFNATLADLRALTGGVIEMENIGAKMTRSGIDITLTVGPYVVALDPLPVPDPDLDPDQIPETDWQAAFDALKDAHAILVTNMIMITATITEDIEDNRIRLTEVEDKLAAVALAAG